MDSGRNIIVESAGASLRSVVSGRPEGPWLTCLHALAADLTIWEPQIGVLGGAFRVLRIDLRGHGGSTLGAAERSLATLINDVRQVWRALGVTQTMTMGLSLGGMIGIGLALEYPEQVSRLVAVGCRSDAPPAFQFVWDTREALLESGGMTAVADATLATWITENTRLRRPELAASLRKLIEATSPEAYRFGVAAIRNLDFKVRLAALTLPTRFIVGREDGAIPAAMAEMAQISGAALDVIEGAAHLVNLEQPTSFLNSVIPFLGEDRA